MADQMDAASRGNRARHERLADETMRWLAGLPENVRPQQLPIRFPRIANALCLRWGNRDVCRTYLDDLLLDKRGTRQGLPSEVVEELATLKNFFETVLYPVPQTVWDEVAERRRKR